MYLCTQCPLQNGHFKILLLAGTSSMSYSHTSGATGWRLLQLVHSTDIQGRFFWVFSCLTENLSSSSGCVSRWFSAQSRFQQAARRWSSSSIPTMYFARCREALSSSECSGIPLSTLCSPYFSAPSSQCLLTSMMPYQGRRSIRPFPACISRFAPVSNSVRSPESLIININPFY